MMADGRLVGLDTGANFENTVLLDVSHFLNHLELSLLDPRAIRLLPKRQTLIDRFKNGYGGFTENIEFCSAWFRLLAAVRLWSEHQNQERSVFYRYNNFRYFYLVRRLIAGLG
jgi:hypothetical protein